MDTGATYSYISHLLCKELVITIKKSCVQTSVLADGSDFKTMGLATVPVHFDKEPLIMTFRVAPNLYLPIIIGRDMMQVHKIVADIPKNLIWIGPKAFDMNRSELQSALQTNLLFSIESRSERKRNYVYQFIRKDNTTDNDQHSNDIVLPDIKQEYTG